MESYSDTELIIQIKNDNHSAFDAVFERHWERLFSIAYTRVQDESEAQDIVQELFINLWERRSTLSIHTALENYLAGAVKLKVISHFRSKKANERNLQDALTRINYLENSVYAVSDYLQLEKTLEEALGTMPDMLKKIYTMRSENRSIKDIATELGLADQTVKNYISEVTRRLRIVIAQKHPEKKLTYLAILMVLLYK